MPKLDPELKKQLLDEGRWAEFKLYREDLKEGGVSNVEAHHQAVAKFFDNVPPPKKRSSPPKAPPPPPTKEEVAASADVKVKAYTGNLPSLPMVKSDTFDDKKCTEVEAVRWVADNMMVENPKPEDCPSAAAWGMLGQCRSSMISQSDFWKQTYPKLLPSKTEMEKARDGASNESKAMEVIDKLLDFKEEAENAEPEEEATVSVSGGIVGEIPDSVTTTTTETAPTSWSEGEF